MKRNRIVSRIRYFLIFLDEIIDGRSREISVLVALFSNDKSLIKRNKAGKSTTCKKIELY